MRFVSSSLILSTAFLLSSGMLVAQDQSQPMTSASQAAPAMQFHKPANPHHQAKRMAKNLGLSADQEAKLEPILAERDQQMQNARADTTLSVKDKRTKIRGIKQESDNRIEANLSDTQKQQYEQMKLERQAKKHAQAGSSSNS
jgi:protein CpxP